MPYVLAWTDLMGTCSYPRFLQESFAVAARALNLNGLTADNDPGTSQLERTCCVALYTRYFWTEQDNWMNLSGFTAMPRDSHLSRQQDEPGTHTPSWKRAEFFFPHFSSPYLLHLSHFLHMYILSSGSYHLKDPIHAGLHSLRNLLLLIFNFPSFLIARCFAMFCSLFCPFHASTETLQSWLNGF